MRLIIHDFFRRWGWVYVAAILFAAGFIVLSFVSFGGKKPIYPVAVYLGGFLLLFEFTRGSARALATLPVSAEEIANAWWHLAVSIPVVITTALRILLMLVIGSSIDWELAGFSALWDLLFAGGAYFVLTMQPFVQRSAALAGVWGASWGLIFGSVALVSNFLPGRANQFTPTTVAAALIGAGMVGLSLARARELTLARIAMRPAAWPAAGSGWKSTRRTSMADHLTGLPLWLWCNAAPFAQSALFLFLLLNGLNALIDKDSFEGFLHRLSSGADTLQGQATYWASAGLLIAAGYLRVGSTMRHLRTLPLSTGALMTAYLLPGMIGRLFFWLVPMFFGLIISKTAPSAAFVAWFFVAAGLCAIGEALLLRTGNRTAMFGVTILTPAAIMMAHRLVQAVVDSGTPWAIPAMLIFAAMTFCAAIFTALRALESSPSVYRPRDIMFHGAWGKS